MLKYGNKEFRNLQEQVEENMKDIQDLMQGTVVLNEFGIKVIGEVASVDDMPTVEEYKEEHENWEYGDSYAVGTEPPYTMYILTRANDENPDDYWFNIGIFPMPGPQGEQGIQGQVGPQGQTGPQGDSAGFGTVSATATTLPSGSQATASVTTSGPDTAKDFAFTFGIPQNTPAGFTHYITITPNGATSGTLGQSEYNTLYDNYDSIIRLRVGSIGISYYFLKKWSVTEDYMRYICLWSVNNNDTRYYLITIDRSNRKWTLESGQPFKVSQYNINSGSATSGQVLTADGSGGASWQDGASGVSTVTINVTSGTFSNDDYIKVASDGCTIIYNDGTTKVSFRKYDEDSTTITYAGPFTEGSITYWYGLTISKSGKTWVLSSSAMPISATNIKSGSYLSGLVLTTNGSGGASWESLPTPQSLAWGNITGTLSNQTDLKNALDGKQDEITQPDTPTGTIYEYLGFTSAGVVSKNTMIPVSKISDIADVAITGSYTDLLNQPSIPTATSDLTNDSGYLTSSTGVTSVNGNTGAITNICTLNTSQTISGGKTFTGGLSAYDSLELKNGLGVFKGSIGIVNQNDVLVYGKNKIRFINDANILFPSTGYGLVIPTTTGYTEDKTIATVDQIPNAVSGTNDGTNWTTLTIGSVTKNIPAGGSGSGVSDVTIDGTSIVSNNVAAMTTETWTFTLANGNTVTKKVVLG